MSIDKHGLTVGIDRINNKFYLTLKAVGKLTHEDYKVITPVIDSALKGIKEPKIDALMDITDLDGWELRAVWDDFKLGLQHGSEFEKIALYGNKKWQEVVTKVGSWFMSGEVQYFENINDAMFWLKN